MVIHNVESKKSFFRQAAEKVDFGAHLTPFWKGFGRLLGNFGAKGRTLAFLKRVDIFSENRALNHN